MLLRRLHKYLYYLLVICWQFFGIRRVSCLPDVRATCRIVPGLTREQLELCYRASDVTSAAIDGLELAIKECQFQWHRWNCSSLSTKSRNPHSSNLFKRGFRESAFAYAISAAGVSHSVARACSQGRLLSCGCDPALNRKSLSKSLRESLEREKKLFLDNVEDNNFIVDKHLEQMQHIDNIQDNQVFKKKLKLKMANRWKWGGCSHNMDFGVEFSELFLDSREKAGDIQSQINLHNNQVGRLAVRNNMQVRCKCHGMSGSCQLKTCWKSSPDFRVVGKVLKQQFRRAVMVDQSNLGNGMIIRDKKPKKRKSANFRPAKTMRTMEAVDGSTKWKKGKKNRMDNSLFYYQRSPNFCDKDQVSDIPGTFGRRCNRTSTGSESCASMCCGRGYNLIREQRVERCKCKFHWCCHVECEECDVEEWISICK